MNFVLPSRAKKYGPTLVAVAILVVSSLGFGLIFLLVYLIVIFRQQILQVIRDRIQRFLNVRASNHRPPPAHGADPPEDDRGNPHDMRDWSDGEDADGAGEETFGIAPARDLPLNRTDSREDQRTSSSFSSRNTPRDSTRGSSRFNDQSDRSRLREAEATSSVLLEDEVHSSLKVTPTTPPSSPYSTVGATTNTKRRNVNEDCDTSSEVSTGDDGSVFTDPHLGASGMASNISGAVPQYGPKPKPHVSFASSGAVPKTPSQYSRPQNESTPFPSSYRGPNVQDLKNSYDKRNATCTPNLGVRKPNPDRDRASTLKRLHPIDDEATFDGSSVVADQVDETSSTTATVGTITSLSV